MVTILQPSTPAGTVLKKPRRGFEHLYAVAFHTWWVSYARFNHLDERLFFAIPNGGKRPMRTARFLKAEGTVKGIPDYCLAIARKQFHGMFLELKDDEGRMSKEQVEMFVILTHQGYHCVTAHGAREASDAIEKYLESK